MNKEEKENLFTKLEKLGLPAVQAKLASSTWKNSEEECVIEWILTVRKGVRSFVLVFWAKEIWGLA